MQAVFSLPGGTVVGVNVALAAYPALAGVLVSGWILYRSYGYFKKGDRFAAYSRQAIAILILTASSVSTLYLRMWSNFIIAGTALAVELWFSYRWLRLEKSRGHL
jgi:hypothetical protein